jgi:hypothetical protein
VVSCLAGTNILLRFIDRTHARHALVRAAARKLRMNGDLLLATPQNFVMY